MTDYKNLSDEELLKRIRKVSSWLQSHDPFTVKGVSIFAYKEKYNEEAALLAEYTRRSHLRDVRKK